MKKIILAFSVPIAVCMISAFVFFANAQTHYGYAGGGGGTGDMLKSVYDPENIAQPVAFADQVPIDGTADGQLLFWDSGSSWTHTETTELFFDDTLKRLGIGTATPGAPLDVLYPGTQQRWSYDGSNYADFAVNSAGNGTFTPSGGGIGFGTYIAGTTVSALATTSRYGLYVFGSGPLVDSARTNFVSAGSNAGATQGIAIENQAAATPNTKTQILFQMRDADGMTPFGKILVNADDVTSSSDGSMSFEVNRNGALSQFLDLDGDTFTAVFAADIRGERIGLGTGADARRRISTRDTVSTADTETRWNGYFEQRTNAASGTFTGFQGGLYGRGVNINTGTLTNLAGIYADANNFGGGTVTNAIAMQAVATNDGSGGTITSAYGVLSAVKNTGPGTITNAYGLHSSVVNDGGGTVTNAYGLYVFPVTEGVNNWGVYSDGAAPSYFGGSVTVAGDLKMETSVTISGVITPTAFSTHVDNWNPTGLGTCQIIMMSSTANYELRGIVSTGLEGRKFILINVGTTDIKIKHEATTSTAANRFVNGGDLTLQDNDSCVIWYDANKDRWRILSSNT